MNIPSEALKALPPRSRLLSVSDGPPRFDDLFWHPLHQHWYFLARGPASAFRTAANAVRPDTIRLFARQLPPSWL